MKPVSFVAYGDIGLHTGRPITELSRGLHQRGLLDQVYCRGVEAYDLPAELVTTPIPFGRKIPRAMTGVQRYVTERFNKRYYAEQLFDTFAAREVRDTDVQLHHTPGYLRTLRAGNRAGSRTVVKATTEYAVSCYQRIATEHERLGIQPPEPATQQRRIDAQDQTLNECDEILAVSSFVKDSLVDGGFPAEKISVTPLGIDTADYPTSPAATEEQFTVLYIGSVTIGKGIPYLLDAWEHNGWGDDEQARLVLCGHVSSTMRKVLNRYNFENVATPGFVDPRDYHQKASVFAFPSVSDGCPRAPLEAIAAGLPIITTDRTGTTDIITDGEEGFVVPASDAAALADRLKYLRENPTERRRMRERALKTASEQTWDCHAQKVIEALGLQT
ncbi:glycosyltransferase family 4 protein [Haloarcula sediminis]|uniref:glycosyltransferase family 4 protein n=1 Tax=Haloarcula sediminis TaxID=3111777 RepID=UPI002D774ADE|nr:glycosyltransferase family 4 protein [Haloarcula sp. CK38]